MKGFFARLQRNRRDVEFGSDRYWQPSLTAPVAAPLERSPIMERHVRLTLVQSLICGFFATALPLAVALFASNDWRVWLATVVCFFLLSSGVAWFLLFFKDRQLLWAAEKVLGVDLNRDGMVAGQKVVEPSTTFVDFTNRDERYRLIKEMPVSTTIMREIAQAVRAGYNFSRRDMMAKTSISDEQFGTLQRRFLESGWAVYKKEGKPNSGVELLAAGRAVLKKYL